jgi:anti-anti-sigma regulatory factor
MKLKLALLCTLMSTSAYALDVSFGTGEDVDCDVARSFAVKDALQRYAEQEFAVNKQKVCTEKNAEGVDCTYIRSIETDSVGSLKKILSEKRKQGKDTCVVEVKVEVEKARQLLGQVKAQDSYRAGEAFRFEVFTQEPLYVYVFNMYNVNSISMLYPLEDNRNNLVDGRLELPDHVAFTAALSPGVVKSKETLMTVFTRHKISFERASTRKDVFDVISSVPRYSRKIVYHNFVIERR